MRNLTFITILVFFITGSKAQDIIYLTQGLKQTGHITAINSDKVKYRKTANPAEPIRSSKISDVLLLFNSFGDYLVVKDGPMYSDQERDDFLNITGVARPNDIVITLKGDIYAGLIMAEESNSITCVCQGHVNKWPVADVAVVIRKDGSHKLYVAADKAQPALIMAKQKIAQFLKLPPESMSAANALKQDAVVSAPNNSNTPVALPTPLAGTSQRPDIKQAPAGNDVMNSTQTSGSSSSQSQPGPANFVVVTDTSSAPEVPDDLEKFRALALQKVRTFTSYIHDLSLPDVPAARTDKLIELTLGLFASPESWVETSVAHNYVPPKKYKIKDYLDRIAVRSGHYDRIAVNYADINYSSKFKRGQDGNYYAHITCMQKFQGFKDGQMIYGDIVKRNFTVVLKYYRVAETTGYVGKWDVFLSDIGVEETWPIKKQ